MTDEDIVISDEMLARKVYTDMMAADNHKKYIAEALGQMQLQIIILGQYTSYLSDKLAQATGHRILDAEEFMQFRTMEPEEFKKMMAAKLQEERNAKPKIITL